MNDRVINSLAGIFLKEGIYFYPVVEVSVHG